jgi:hypothetical protein
MHSPLGTSHIRLGALCGSPPRRARAMLQLKLTEGKALSIPACRAVVSTVDERLRLAALQTDAYALGTTVTHHQDASAQFDAKVPSSSCRSAAWPDRCEADSRPRAALGYLRSSDYAAGQLRRGVMECADRQYPGPRNVGTQLTRLEAESPIGSNAPLGGLWRAAEPDWIMSHAHAWPVRSDHA